MRETELACSVPICCGQVHTELATGSPGFVDTCATQRRYNKLSSHQQQHIHSDHLPLPRPALRPPLARPPLLLPRPALDPLALVELAPLALAPLFFLAYTELNDYVKDDSMLKSM